MSNTAELKREQWVFTGIGVEAGGKTRLITYAPLNPEGELGLARYNFKRPSALPIVGGVYEVAVQETGQGLRYIIAGKDKPKFLRAFPDLKRVAQWRLEVQAVLTKEAAQRLEEEKRRENTDLSAMKLSELREFYRRRARGELGRGAVIAAIIGYLNKP